MLLDYFLYVYVGFDVYTYRYILLQDIRSYFTPVATSQKKNSKPGALKPQKRRVISSDEDEKSKSPTKRSKVCHVTGSILCALFYS